MNRSALLLSLATAAALSVGSIGCNKSADHAHGEGAHTHASGDDHHKAGGDHHKAGGDHHETGGDHHNTAPASQPAKVGKGESPADRGQVDPDGVVRRGDDFTVATSMSVADTIDKAKTLAGKKVKIEGTVSQVCAKKGCWFAIAPSEDAKPAETIRITSKGYRFFVPRDAVGQKATIEGELEVKTMSVEEAQHMADDAAEASGEPAEKVTEEQVEVRIAAVAVELKKADG